MDPNEKSRDLMQEEKEFQKVRIRGKSMKSVRSCKFRKTGKLKQAKVKGPKGGRSRRFSRRISFSGHFDAEVSDLSNPSDKTAKTTMTTKKKRQISLFFDPSIEADLEDEEELEEMERRAAEKVEAEKRALEIAAASETESDDEDDVSDWSDRKLSEIDEFSYEYESDSDISEELQIDDFEISSEDEEGTSSNSEREFKPLQTREDFGFAKPNVRMSIGSSPPRMLAKRMSMLSSNTVQSTHSFLGTNKQTSTMRGDKFNSDLMRKTDSDGPRGAAGGDRQLGSLIENEESGSEIEERKTVKAINVKGGPLPILQVTSPNSKPKAGVPKRTSKLVPSKATTLLLGGFAV